MLAPFIALVAVCIAGLAAQGHVTRCQAVGSASKSVVARTNATAYRDAQWNSLLHNNTPALKKRSMVWCNSMARSAAHDASGSVRHQNYLSDPKPPSTCEDATTAAEPALHIPCQREEMENRQPGFQHGNFGLDTRATRSRTLCILLSRCLLAHIRTWTTYKEQGKAEHRRWQGSRMACNTGSPVARCVHTNPPMGCAPPPTKLWGVRVIRIATQARFK